MSLDKQFKMAKQASVSNSEQDTTVTPAVSHKITNSKKPNTFKQLETVS
jgi:hypothetical protein